MARLKVSAHIVASCGSYYFLGLVQGVPRGRPLCEVLERSVPSPLYERTGLLI